MYSEQLSQLSCVDSQKPNLSPSFFQVLDVARRIAGTGSLGVQRYVILIGEKGSIGGHYLLDLKQSLGSCIAPHFKYLQPLWRVQAHRIGALQRRKQTMLQPVQFEGSAYVLCELQPTKDRVSLDRAQQNNEDLEMTIFEIGGYPGGYRAAESEFSGPHFCCPAGQRTESDRVGIWFGGADICRVLGQHARLGIGPW